jgi:outer membrane protein OmpA-like peptidoglycan-associated protein
MPRHSKAPRGWVDCGFPGETAVDVQPDPMNQFQVRKAPQQGNTYLGMVVRDNDTWERVSQELSSPMVAEQCYEMRIHLARSEVYLSLSRINDNQRANYVTPAKLRIWGGFGDCDQAELIGETSLVTNYRWLEYPVKLEPSQDYTHIVFEAFYNTPTLFPYNGNVLLDNASALVPIPCERPIASQTTPSPLLPPEKIPEDPEVPPADTPPAKPTPLPTPEPKPPVARQVDIRKATSEDLKVGRVFQIETITFAPDQAEFTPESREMLEEIYDFMVENPNVVIEVGGHASSRATEFYAQQISTQRAEAVVRYLQQRGIEPKRLFARGYGNKVRIATDDTPEGRRRNQRVEIKILRT